MSAPRLLGVLLCYNDGDILADAIRHLLDNGHHVIVWNHGSTDETASVLKMFRHELLEATDISRNVDFYDLYPLMSKHLLTNYVQKYDWISWPDQDEILEGPTRDKSYRENLAAVVESRHNWIEFNDFVYWFTDRDDAKIESPCERVRHYSLAKHGPPKIRSWRASATNIRWFNHNMALGSRYPALFNLRHYPMRSPAQMKRRLSFDRAGIQRGPVNFHYEHMKEVASSLDVKGEDLHFDDGQTALNPAMNFNWTRIYGSAPKLPREVAESFLLRTKKWEIAALLKKGIATLPSPLVAQYGQERIDRWLGSLDSEGSSGIVVAIKKDAVIIVTPELSRKWTEDPQFENATGELSSARWVGTMLGEVPVCVWADSVERCIRIVVSGIDPQPPNDRAPLLALVPCYGGDVCHLTHLHDGSAEFPHLPATYYFLTCEPVGHW